MKSQKGKCKTCGVVSWDCNRCGHQWVSHNQEGTPPKKCPECTSFYYNSPRKFKKKV